MSSHPQIRALLLDVDGTLIDTAELLIAALRHATLKHLKRQIPDEEFRNLLGRPLQKQMEYFCPAKATEMAADFLTYYEKHQDMEQPFTEALELLSWSKAQGVKSCLVTSKTAYEMEMTGRRFPGLLEADAIVTSDQTKKVKPHPDPALLALHKLGIINTEALMIGDSPYDLQCGRSAGAFTGAALWGPFPRAMLDPGTPDFWFESPADVRETIKHTVKL